MSGTIEALYDRIGEVMADLGGDGATRTLVRAEITDAVRTVDVFVERQAGAYRCLRDGEARLVDLLVDLRSQSMRAGMGEWSQATCILGPGDVFQLTFGFADIGDADDGPQRRGRWIADYLGADATIF